MATVPIGWHNVGPFNCGFSQQGDPLIPLNIFISEDGSKVVLAGCNYEFGATDVTNVFWVSGTDPLCASQYEVVVSPAYTTDFTATFGRGWATNDLSILVIPQANDYFLVVRGITTPETATFEQHFYPENYVGDNGFSWCSGSADGSFIVLGYLTNAGTYYVYYSVDYGVNWSASSTGTFRAQEGCVSGSNPDIIYMSNFKYSSGDNQAYTTTGLGGLAYSRTTTYPRTDFPKLTDDGTKIYFVASGFDYADSGASRYTSGINGGELLYNNVNLSSPVIAIDGTGSIVLYSEVDEPGEFVKYSTDAGSTWIDGPATGTYFINVAKNGSRLGGIDDDIGEVWLTGLLSEPTGNFVLSGTAPGISVAPAGPTGTLSLVGYIPSIEAISPIGLLNLVGYIPSIEAISPIGLLNLVGYIPIISADPLPYVNIPCLDVTPFATPNKTPQSE